MLIRCPKCGTGFNLAEDKIPAKGAKVRCSACTHTFRVRMEDGQAVFFYKKGKEEPPAGTAVGSPGMLAAAGLAEESEKTQFGFPQRQRTTSKSAEEGYNPFPLAGRARPVGDDETVVADSSDRAQLLGGGLTVPVEDIPLGEFAGPNDRTQLGALGLAEESMGDRTQLGAPVSVVEDDAELESGDRTRAFGSGGIDLFDGAPPKQREEPVVDAGVDFDPFEDAFDEPVGDVGLLMPSTPQLMEEASHPDSGPLPLQNPDQVDSEAGLSPDDFLLGGGGGSDFGDEVSAVDHEFGVDIASFDPNGGVDSPPPTAQKRGTRTKSRAAVLDLDAEIGLEDVRAPKAPEPRTPSRSKAPAVEPAKPAVARRPVPAYAQTHAIGSTSAVRRTFDLVFIVLVVAVAFIALVTARTGGFVDFNRFGHMVEVAFSGTDFIPREEWKQVVEIQPPDLPPDEPLRVENVRALEREVSGQHVLMISGRVRNYSLKEFKSVQIRLAVTQGEKKVSEKLRTVGQSLDREKVEKAKTAADLQASVMKKSPDLGKEGVTYFAVVFEDVPSNLVKSGKYDYSVVIAD